MRAEMKSENHRWIAKHKSTQVLNVFKGKTAVSEATGGMENALRAKPHDILEQYEHHLKELQEAYGEAMLEIDARKKLQSLLEEEEK